MAGLPVVARAMLQPSIYPNAVESVSLVQTQMSFLFLAGDYVYKVKKPVNLGYLDYTTLTRRRALCRQEVMLNRRLTSDVYLGVSPIRRVKGGHTLDGRGRAVEYAVRMRRLPGDRMLNVLLDRDTVTPEMMRHLAVKMAGFHHEAARGPEIDPFGSPAAVKVNVEENFTQTEKYVGRLVTPGVHHLVSEWAQKYLSDRRALFEARVDAGRIRDCHGDLHAQHICFADAIQVYDCIEFNDRFRYCDVASEISFLAMDLDRYGRGDLARIFVEAYLDASGDRDIRGLLGFYKCYRACVRAKVEGFKSDDPYIGAAEKAVAESAARLYWQLAARYARSRPLLVIMTGLMGTGKSTLAERLARQSGFDVLSSDILRKNLAGVPLSEHRMVGQDAGIYNSDFTQRTYNALYSKAASLLALGQDVILDASFKKRVDRARAREVADAAGADFLIVECVLNEAETRARLDRRMSEGISPSDGRWELYAAQKGEFDIIDGAVEGRRLVVNTAVPAAEAATRLLGEIWL
jgi:aminoglycoside phosphotransferase family enzyme/predicted kinase